MINENDLRRLLLDEETRRWHDKNIAPKTGFLYDWDGSSWALERKNYQYFLRFLLAVDLETRSEYLRKRRQNDAADETANFDEAFLTAYLAESCEREKDFAKKASALYFAWNEDLRAWFQYVWLNNDDNWVYNPERDDEFLAKILANEDLRVKTPDVVQRIFCDWSLPFVGSLIFRRAQKYGYQVEELTNDVYERLFGANGRRKNAKNAIDFWRKEMPTKSLRDWIRLETLRELERALKKRQRAARTAIYLSGDLSFVAKTMKSAENSLRIDAQTLFDQFYTAAPSDATLCAIYWNSNLTFSELTAFFGKKVDGKALNKRYERALKRFRKVCEGCLDVEISRERWAKIVKIFLESTEQQNETKEECEALSHLRGGGNVERLDRVRFVGAPTENDKELLLRVLEAKRVDETGRVIRLLRQKVQGGGFDTNVTMPITVCRCGDSPIKERAQDSLGGFRRSDVPAKENAQSSLFQDFQRPPGICGAPVNSFDAKSVRNYWRNKYSENDSVLLYFEAAEAAFSSPTYWHAEARLPLFAAADAEVPVFFGGYNPLNAAPCTFSVGEKTSPILHGVAVVALADLRAFVEKGELPCVTVLQRCVDDGKRTRWHVKHDSKVRLLMQKSIVPDKER